MIRIGHCQLAAKYDDFDGNLAKVIEGLRRAERERVEIVSFPECFLTDYPDTGELARKTAFAIDSPQVMKVLDETSTFDVALIVGFNEIRGEKLYNTALVAYKGHLLGTYSKCFAYQPFHTQGRAFPVFEHHGVMFGVVICADGGYIEPTRILALKGARIVFAPHYNYISEQGLLDHFMRVRSDHTARAMENGIYFVRGNNVVFGHDTAITRNTGVGYGDSYIVDPMGEILVRSRRHQEDFIIADVDTDHPYYERAVNKSRTSFNELKKFFLEAVAG